MPAQVTLLHYSPSITFHSASLGEDTLNSSFDFRQQSLIFDLVHSGNQHQDFEMDEDEVSRFDLLCAFCDNGGALVVCGGKCLRSFHATVSDGAETYCESLGLTDAELRALRNFWCKNCEYKQHQCFACGQLGYSDELSGAEVFRCASDACKHFYHPDCVSKLLHVGNEAAAETHRQMIASGEQFVCPVHQCHVCEGPEVDSFPDFQFAICRRCPRAYHRKCMPREIKFDDMDVDEQIVVQRAWEGLLPKNRILIYCLDHEINPGSAAPVRNHIRFPDPLQENVERLPQSSNNRALRQEFEGLYITRAGEESSSMSSRL